MSDFDTHFDAVATDDHFARFADEVIYRARGGEPVTLLGILGAETREERDKGGRRVWHRVQRCRVTDRTAEPTLGIVAPQATGTLKWTAKCGRSKASAATGTNLC